MRKVQYAALVLLILVGLSLFSFMLPVESWRTGESPAAPLVTSPPRYTAPPRLWVDTDAACGHARRSDPDDCLALLRLAGSDGTRIAGISTVFGNAEIAVTDRTTRALAARLRDAGHALPGVHRGAAGPLVQGSRGGADAEAALAAALRDGPLTILALGPLTNVAATLRTDPALARNVTRVVAVMGRRPGHLFHPSEGKGDGILFGHGPVFSDLNYRMDPAAAEYLLSTGVPLTLIPYEAARDVMVTQADLDRLAASGPAGAWVAGGARGWMEFWRDEVGLPGFYPFDLMAAHHVLAPADFLCADVHAEVRTGWAPDWLWVLDSAGLVVTPGAPAPEKARTVSYCPQVRAGAAIARVR